MDLIQVANACAVECIRQQVGADEFSNLFAAYQNVHANPFYFIETVGDIKRVAARVDPMANWDGFRNTPVTFADGGSSADWANIPRLMDNLIVEFVDYMRGVSHVSVDFLVKEFLWIHPFRDGNGRVAFLLQNTLDVTLDNPNPLRKHF